MADPLQNKRKRVAAEDEEKEEEETATKIPSDDDRDTVTLIIKCNDKDGKEFVFKVKQRRRLRKLLLAFCKHVELDYRSTRFLINQRAFLHHQTPNQLGLKDYDQIDAMVDGNGG